MSADKTHDKTDKRLTTTQVSRILGVNEAYVRRLHSTGELTDVELTPLGRLYNPEEVEFLRQQRELTKIDRV